MTTLQIILIVFWGAIYLILTAYSWLPRFKDNVYHDAYSSLWWAITIVGMIVLTVWAFVWVEV